MPLDGDAALWRGAPDDREAPLVVCLHGLGGTEDDWARWAHLAPDGARVVSLRAPVPLRDRWSWVDHERDGVAGVSAAARSVHDLLDDVATGPVVAVGWSQGGATAIHLARQRPDRLAAVAVGAGFVWERRPHRGLAARRPPAFFGIGDRDKVIPPLWTSSARGWLAAHTELTSRVWAGLGHDLTEPIAAELMGFASAHLDERRG